MQCMCGCGTEVAYRYVAGHHNHARVVDWRDRYWKFVTPGATDACWEWRGSRHQGGYGRLNIDGKVHYAHRLAWEMKNGPIPDGLFVCHRCNNGACCNPAHMFLGTPADNNWDKAAKGRTVNPLTDALKARTHCPKGHPYDEKNTLWRSYQTKRGVKRHKACRACLLAWGKSWFARKQREKHGAA